MEEHTKFGTHKGTEGGFLRFHMAGGIKQRGAIRVEGVLERGFLEKGHWNRGLLERRAL